MASPEHKNIKETPQNFHGAKAILESAGYKYIPPKSHDVTELHFLRRTGSDGYPRYHLIIDTSTSTTSFHFDVRPHKTWNRDQKVADERERLISMLSEKLKSPTNIHYKHATQLIVKGLTANALFSLSEYQHTVAGTQNDIKKGTINPGKKRRGKKEKKRKVNQLDSRMHEDDDVYL